jgi:hypothetical protein
LTRAFLRLGGESSLEPFWIFPAEVPGGLTPLVGIVPGTNGGAPGSGATVEVGVASVGDVAGAAGDVEAGGAEGLRALGVLSFPQAVAIKANAANKTIFG